MGEEWGSGGWTCHHSLAVLLCGAVQNCDSEPKIHLAREEKGGRRKDGDTRDEEARRMAMVEGCRAAVEGVVCSVVQCTLLCPLLCIIPSMNISLITAEKAKWSRVEDACHTAPSAHITHFPPPLDIAMPHISMSPALQASASLLLPHSAHFPLPCPLSPHDSFPPSQLCPRLKYYFYLCHSVSYFVLFIASPPHTHTH